MNWWNKKKAQANDNKKRLIRSRESGAMLLQDLIQCCDGKSNPIKSFSADQIIKATNNLSKSNHILFSEIFMSGYKWYSGKNENHHTILIKKVMMLYGYELEEICRDIVISSMVSGHKNFLKLVGCCLEFQGPAMVYDGVKKHYKLNPSKHPWKKRMKIVGDIATALAYLHTAFPRPFVYRNMNLENILLDEDGVAKLCDFSSCISIPQGETSVKVDGLVGAYDCMDDNYAQNRIVSEKTDVFAIGIVMQNLLAGEQPLREVCVEPMLDVRRRKFSNSLPESMEEQRVDAIADPEMGEISEEEFCRMKAFLMLSQRCIGLRGEVPTMMEVVKELRKIQRSLNASSSPSGETQAEYTQDISSSVLSSEA